MPVALAAYVSGLIGGWTSLWIPVCGLILVWIVSRRALALSLFLFLVAGMLSGCAEHRKSAFLRDPPDGWVELYGVVFHVEEGQIGMQLRSGRRASVQVQLPYGWSTAHLREGDVLRVMAAWGSPEPSLNPGSPEPLRQLRAAGYRGHASRVQAVLREGHIRETWTRYAKRVALGHIQSRVNRLFSAQTSPWVGAMLFGQRSALERTDLDAFRRSGLAHLLAVSGLHVGVLFGALSLLVSSLVSRWPGAARWQDPARFGVLLVAGGVYGVLLGWPASATRALLMLLLASVCRMGGRPGWISRTWMLALFLAALFRPSGLIHDMGTQLSFSAVGGLLTVPWLMRWHLPLGVRPVAAGFSAGTAAFLATAPWLMKIIGWVPVGSVFTGLIGIPLASIFLVLAFAALIVPLGGSTLALLAERVLEGLIGWAHWTASSGYPILRADGSGWMTLTLIIGVVGFMAWPGLSRFLRAAGILSVLLVSATAPDPDILTFTLLDVGQGEAMVLETRNGKALMVDTGPGPAAGMVMARYLARQGVQEGELLLSHGDRDHAGGMERLSDQIHFSRVRAAWQHASLSGTATLMGTRWAPTEHVRILVLHPEEPGKDNLHSMVLLVALPGLRILLTGDVDSATESMVSGRWQALWDGASVRVLKLAHHGSSTSTGPELLGRFRPGVALYAAGRNNAFGHPDPQVIERLASWSIPVFGTQGQGALQVRWNGSRLVLSRWKNRGWQSIQIRGGVHGPGVNVQQRRQSGDFP